MTYTFGIYFTDVVSTHLADTNFDHSSDSDGHHLDDDEALFKFFGSMPTSMFSLVKVITGGVDWGDVSDALGSLRDWPLALYPFIAYIAFALIAFLNVVSGVFMDTAMDRAKKERELFLVRSAQCVLDEVQMGTQGMITWPEFERALEDVDVRTFFNEVDIDISDAKHLFDILDKSQDGLISADEFLKGCARLHGPAKALDLQLMSHEVTVNFQHLEAIVGAVVPLMAQFIEAIGYLSAPSKAEGQVLAESSPGEAGQDTLSYIPLRCAGSAGDNGDQIPGMIPATD
jgi:hypothetical protein